MSQRRMFDETLLSGYLDGELTQGEAQRVRIQLENDPEARRLYEEMRRMREATMTTGFAVPDDDQWDERPRGGLSLVSRGLGWLVVVVWLVAVSGFALWQLATAPEALWAKLFAFGAVAGFGLLLLSVLLDRLRAAPADRYRRVLK